MPKLLMIVAALLLSGNVWAEEFDKSGSLTIDKDSVTTKWTGTCEASVNGIDPHQSYSGRLLFWVFPHEESPVFLINATPQVDPENRTFTESSSGIYKVIARLRGRTVTLHAEVNLDNFNFDVTDKIRCDAQIDTDFPPSVGATLFGATMVTTLMNP